MTFDISHMKCNICYIHTFIKAIDVTHKAIYHNYMYTSLDIRRFRFKHIWEAYCNLYVR